MRQLFWLVPCLMVLGAVAIAPSRAGRALEPAPEAAMIALKANAFARGHGDSMKVGAPSLGAVRPVAAALAVVPFAWIFGDDLSRYYRSSIVYGLLAVWLLAWVGRWVLGSRLAGGLAAAFFAWHPQTIASATTLTGDMAFIAALLAALALARPWLERPPAVNRRVNFAARAGALMLVIAWLVVVAIESAGAFALPNSPALSARALEANALFYARHAAGLTNAFYAPYMAAVAAGSLVCLAWPGRRGRPPRRVLLLLAAWGLAGLAICLAKPVASERVLLPWIPLIDGLVAWGLTRAWAWAPLRRGLPGRLRMALWARAACLVLAFILIRGEYRRTAWIYGASPDHWRQSAVMPTANQRG